MQSGWRFFSRYDVVNDGHEMFATLTDYGGDRYVMEPVRLTKIERGLTLSTPTIPSWASEGPHIDAKAFLQAALEAAWEMGLRPKSFADHTNELTAVRYHLEDMRALAKVPQR